MSSTSQGSAMSAFWENVRVILYALALAMVLRFTIAQPFRIPSGSMQPTLEVGDYIVVTKWSYGYSRYSLAPLEGLLPSGRLFGSSPERGDVVVFRPPHEPHKDYIKRVIGMPGDRIQMIDGVVHINGEAVGMESLGVQEFANGHSGFVERIPAYRETLPGGTSHVIFDRSPRGELDNTREVTVPEGHYFMMGDDRDQSDDSRRSVGFVPADNLVGPATFVVVSFDHTTNLFMPWTLFTGFRAERFLKAVE
ncbi:MAG: signal peptidase I [Terricaulis sp.]|nr:signal peptidase I [Terricaulis sp.]